MGTYVKPTEGISKTAYKSMEPSAKKGGFWVWICSTKQTDFGAGKNKRAYIFGAVYVTCIMRTSCFKKKYQRQREMEQFKDNSIICEYQMIIPMHPHARLELQDPVEVPEYKVGENRQGGLWSPKESQSLWDQLINARFVHEVA
jgi:hypothetical protein